MSFINDDFLLQNETARHLYHTYAEKMPIIDYHCHVPPQEIAEDRHFDNIAQIWLGGDHYKWRLMRSNGVPESEITGDADDKTKFRRFAEMLPRAIGNPMYHWTHLELKRYFGYDGILNEETADEVWQLCNERLKSPEMSVRNIIVGSNVRAIGTTDDPIDDLRWHKRLAEDASYDVAVLPSFRPDRAVNIEKKDFSSYINLLSQASGIAISSVADVKKALSARLDYFCSLGCRATDHGLDYVMYEQASDAEVEEIFDRVMNGGSISQVEVDRYKTAILLHLGREYAKRGLVMQIHYGVIRNANSEMFARIGADTGFDCISTRDSSAGLVRLLDALQKDGGLPKTVLYSLNPQDNEMLGTVIGCFQTSEARGKIQHGVAWWFNDTKSGMEKQLQSFANLSVLGNFIGMLTDSRSFLSYTRHEYFRRILCNMIGGWVENGEYPMDEKQLGRLVQDICYNNANRYFNLQD